VYETKLGASEALADDLSDMLLLSRFDERSAHFEVRVPAPARALDRP